MRGSRNFESKSISLCCHRSKKKIQEFFFSLGFKSPFIIGHHRWIKNKKEFIIMKKKIICYYNGAYKSSIEKKFTKIPLLGYKPNLKNKKNTTTAMIFIFMYIYIYEWVKNHSFISLGHGMNKTTTQIRVSTP